jgi:hypothetical protein
MEGWCKSLCIVYLLLCMCKNGARFLCVLREQPIQKNGLFVYIFIKQRTGNGAHYKKHH